MSSWSGSLRRRPLTPSVSSHLQVLKGPLLHHRERASLLSCVAVFKFADIVFSLACALHLACSAGQHLLKSPCWMRLLTGGCFAGNVVKVKQQKKTLNNKEKKKAKKLKEARRERGEEVSDSEDDL